MLENVENINDESQFLNATKNNPKLIRGRSNTLQVNAELKGSSVKGIKSAQAPDGINSGNFTSSRQLDNSSNNPIKSVLSDLRIEKTCLLCVDPEDKMPFSINLGTSKVDPNLNLECKKVIQSKIERQSFVLKELLDEIGETDPERVTLWTLEDSSSA